MDSIIEVSVRSLVGFIELLILIRIIGKKQLGELRFFYYATGIALGNIAGDMVVHKDIKLIDGLVGMVIWASLTFFLGYISLKLPKIRVILNGEPAIVIKKGIILRDVLASHRLNMDDLSMLLRNNKVFSVRDVDYAILEPNGQLSVLKKAEQEQVTRKDMKIQPGIRYYIPAEIIVDGKVVYKNLKEFNLDSKWLGQQLKQAHIGSVEEVFYAELEEDGSLYTIKNSYMK